MLKTAVHVQLAIVIENSQVHTICTQLSDNEAH